MASLYLALFILAFVCFVVAAIPAVAPRVNFLAIGLALWVLVLVLQTLKVS